MYIDSNTGCFVQDEGARKGGAAASASGAVAQVEAAAASDALEALEGILPAAAAELMDLVAEHVRAVSTCPFCF